MNNTVDSGILLVDKPKGMTSHDVVNKIRRLYHTKKVGHAGTLDPLATGVLVLCLNKATKALQFLSADHKSYIATLHLGEATDTYDSEGEVTATKPFNGYDNLEAVLASFVGDQMQVPPLYSAIKINGKKLYEYARAGETVDVPPRAVHIDQIRLIEANGADITFEVQCSKGTYIRSLCVDIAKALGYPGYMSALRRIQSGQFKIEDCYTLEEIETELAPLMSLDGAFEELPHIVADPKVVMTGQKITSDYDEKVAVYDIDGHLLAIYGPDGHGQLKSLRGLF
ncbi:MAG: tRNA pseudouridine(55) synthase TruB [Erysipelotrichaceae bacterium]|nr:tRNA pseudouridine(55) synthase TruB [Erysipelotrichaceae bacterium]